MWKFVRKQNRQIKLSNNFISSVSNLSGLRELTTLNLGNNHLTDADSLRHLLGCPSISVLDLTNNRIHDAAVLDVLAALAALRVEALQRAQHTAPQLEERRAREQRRGHAVDGEDESEVGDERQEAARREEVSRVRRVAPLVGHIAEQPQQRAQHRVQEERPRLVEERLDELRAVEELHRDLR